MSNFRLVQTKQAKPTGFRLTVYAVPASTGRDSAGVVPDQGHYAVSHVLRGCGVDVLLHADLYIASGTAGQAYLIALGSGVDFFLLRLTPKQAADEALFLFRLLRAFRQVDVVHA